MGQKIREVDAYIAKAAPFAQPILLRLRKLVHQGCPAVVEEIKWSMPHFTYKGMFCGMAAFKRHAAFGFWKTGDLFDQELKKTGEAMGQFGCIASLADLPTDAVLLDYIRRAAALKDAGIEPPRAKRAARKPLPVPPDLAAGLKKNARAQTVFKAFTPGKRREYIEWITEAKADATRQRRLSTALEWIAQGKARNWKYEKC